MGKNDVIKVLLVTRKVKSDYGWSTKVKGD